MPAKTYGVICTKGGVGKTTVTAFTGAILADMGQRVLLVDADPQQSLSRFYSIASQAPFGLSQLYRNANPEGCISKTTISNLDIVINDDSGGDNGAITNFLRESFTHIQHLHAALQTLSDQYDYILIDTQGAKGIIQESVIFASDILLSPVKPQVLDSREFIHGTVDLINKFKPKPGFTSMTGRALPPVKVLINMWDRTVNADQVSRYLRSEFDRQIDGYNPRVTQNPNYEDIKESIRNRGLGHAPNITRQSPDRPYMVKDGGNTRLAILNELWQNAFSVLDGDAFDIGEAQNQLEADIALRLNVPFSSVRGEIHAIAQGLPPDGIRPTNLISEAQESSTATQSTITGTQVASVSNGKNKTPTNTKPSGNQSQQGHTLNASLDSTSGSAAIEQQLQTNAQPSSDNIYVRLARMPVNELMHHCYGLAKELGAAFGFESLVVTAEGVGFIGFNGFHSGYVLLAEDPSTPLSSEGTFYYLYLHQLSSWFVDDHANPDYWQVSNQIPISFLGDELNDLAELAKQIAKAESDLIEIRTGDIDEQEDGMAVLFTGQWHDSFPRQLVLDQTRSPLEKVTWQAIRLSIDSPSKPGSTPRREELAAMINCSAATVTTARTMLRTCRWITFCKTVRKQGRFVGDIYLLHDQPLSLEATLKN
jgi:chromosome partitioning related protein ParA